MSTPEEKSFILDLETKKNEYNAALSAYETTRNTYLNLSRKFVFYYNSSIKTNETPEIDMTSDTKEKCMTSCVQNTLCAAADFNPTTKKCAVYQNYQDSDVVDLSDNLVIAPDTLTEVTAAVEADIETTKSKFNAENADLDAKCSRLIAILSDPKYNTYRDAQSKQNQDFLKALRDKKALLQRDREYIDGDLFEQLFSVTESVKRSKMTADQNFYIQIVLGVFTVIAIAAAVYYLWPTAVVPGSTPVQTNALGAQPNPYPGNPLRTQLNPYPRRGGGRSLSNQSYFVIGGILLFSIIVSQLRIPKAI